MNRTTFECSVISPALQFGMLADRVGAVLWKAEQGRELSDADRRALGNMRGFLRKAMRGGEVLETRRMENYSFEAMSAYEAATNAAQNEHVLTKQEVSDTISFLREVDRALEAAEKGEAFPGGWTLARLSRFSKAIVSWCLRVTAEPLESVSC